MAFQIILAAALISMATAQQYTYRAPQPSQKTYSQGSPGYSQKAVTYTQPAAPYAPAPAYAAGPAAAYGAAPAYPAPAPIYPQEAPAYSPGAASSSQFISFFGGHGQLYNEHSQAAAPVSPYQSESAQSDGQYAYNQESAYGGQSAGESYGEQSAAVFSAPTYSGGSFKPAASSAGSAYKSQSGGSSAYSAPTYKRASPKTPSYKGSGASSAGESGSSYGTQTESSYGASEESYGEQSSGAYKGQSGASVYSNQAAGNAGAGYSPQSGYSSAQQAKSDPSAVHSSYEFTIGSAH
ncbi:uncharacterized protein [Bemisia tabaci]